jgi:glycosyltransferase involved in cell wall biosynthesis
MINVKLFIVVNNDCFFLSHRLPVAIAAQQAGYDVTVLASNTGSSKKIESLGIKFTNIPIDKCGKNVFKELKTVWFLYDCYRRGTPDIVHHVGPKIILLGLLAAKFAKVKGIVNAVSGLGSYLVVLTDNNSIIKKRLVVYLKFIFKQKCIATIFQNKEDRDLFIKNKIVEPETVHITNGSGVDWEHEFQYSQEPIEGKIKVVLCARMLKEKGIMEFVEAAASLKNEYADKVQFLLCGDLDTNPNTVSKEYLDSVCDGEYLKWLGYVSDIISIIRSSHINVLPSYYREGLPKSLIEAAAIGRPIITTDNVGCRECVLDGYNGFIVPVKNVEQLAHKIEILLNDTTLRIQMGKNSRSFAEKHFGIKDVVAKHLEIYEQILKTSKKIFPSEDSCARANSTSCPS